MSSSSSESGSSFIDGFVSLNPFFVSVDEEFVEDSFNLTGLRKLLGDDADSYQDALNHILEGGPLSAALAPVVVRVFGLIHARFLTTVRGGQLLLENVERNAYGPCPRHACSGARTMPVGLADTLTGETVKLFCPRCQELYTCSQSVLLGPALAAQVARLPMEGAFFGSSATPMLVLANPHLLEMPSGEAAPAPEPYRLRIYGFLISPLGKLAQKKEAAKQPTADVANPASSGSDSNPEPDEDVARNQKKRERVSTVKEAEEQ